jgi:PAS domain S-box-containing protein
MGTRRWLSQLDRDDTSSLAAGVATLLAVAALTQVETYDWTRIYTTFGLWVTIVAFASLFKLPSASIDFSLANVLILGAYLSVELEPAAWAALLGTLFAEIGQTLWVNPPGLPRRSALRTTLSAAREATPRVFSLLAAVLAYRIVGGQTPLWGAAISNALAVAVLFITHFVVNNLISAALLKIQGVRPVRDHFRRNMRTLVLRELVPLPLAVPVAAIYSELGSGLFAGFCLYLVVMLIFTHRTWQARDEAEQRVRQLTTLSAIGVAMRASLDLPELLEAIHQKIGRLLDARNFYVALYNTEDDEISFPLYYEDGGLCHPRPRPLGNGMIGCVIRSRLPLLIRENPLDAIALLGLDDHDGAADSWLGVPIVADDQILGIIAVQSQTPRAYDHRHLKLLTTIAAQAAVTMRNAQLYSAMRQRAAELAILNSISTAVGATLDLERILRIITTSIGRVTGCSKAAIFLMNETGDELYLAQSHGLNPAYVEAARRLKIGPGERGMVAATRRLLVVPDVMTTPGFEAFAPLAQAEGFHALAEAPLMAQNAVIGTLATYFSEVHPFTLAEVDLLETFANQTAAAVNNARLYARTDQALARRVKELSALEEIGRELASTLDVTRIAKRIVERTLQVTGAQMGRVILLDDTSASGQILAQHGDPTRTNEPYLRETWPLNRGIVGRVLRTGLLAHVADVRLDSDYVEADPNVRSQLSVPIVHEGRILGAITLESHQEAAFDKAAIAFTQQIANQAAIALENARLFSERAQQINALSQLHEAGLALTSSLDLRQVLDRVASAARELTDADAVTLHLYDYATDQFLPGATAGPPLPGDGIASIRPRGMTRQAMQQRRLIYVGDTGEEPDANIGLVNHGIRSLVCMPVIGHDQVLGILNIYSRQPRKFSEASVHLVSALVNQAAAAIENSRLFQAVAEGRDKLHAILSSSREGVLMFDLAGRVAIANPMLDKMIGIPRLRLEGELLADLMDMPGPDFAAQLGYDSGALLALLDQIQHDPSWTDANQIYQLVQPSTRFVERSGMPVLDAHGGLAGWMITLRDVTEERELQQMRDDLTRMIVHDLRSPLSAIFSGLELLSEMLPEEGLAGPMLDAVSASQHSCIKLLNLVNTLLDISKMEAGQMTMSLQPTDLAELVGHAVDWLSPLAQAQGITVTSYVSENWQVLADEEKMGRVLTNLVDNALKFTPAGGRITVTAERAPGEERVMRCAVHDSGSGIPPEYRERIFDRFVQVKGPRGRRRGTGLGLTFCKLVVEAHGGRIWVESEEGKGSTFYFTLPMPGDA